MRFSSVIRGRNGSGNKGSSDRAKTPAASKSQHQQTSTQSSKVNAVAPSPTAKAASPRNLSSSTAVTANTSTVTPMHMSPSSCTVLIVDKRFLKGVYYTASSGSPTMRGGPALDDVVFVQELLEIYGQVVAVLSGDTALRWIFNNTGNKSTIVLIDVDETYNRSRGDDSSCKDSLFCGPIYTPPSSPQDQHDIDASQYSQRDSGLGKDAPESQDSGPYGLALLRVIAHYVAIGVFRNVAPI
ncbi:hypothetical protein EV175_005468, partial [Coemansia sp. RSA 1933]